MVLVIITLVSGAFLSTHAVVSPSTKPIVNICQVSSGTLAGFPVALTVCLSSSTNQGFVYYNTTTYTGGSLTMLVFTKGVLNATYNVNDESNQFTNWCQYVAGCSRTSTTTSYSEAFTESTPSITTSIVGVIGIRSGHLSLQVSR